MRAQLAELRAYVEGEAHGRVHVECSDVGHPGVGVEALLGVMSTTARVPHQASSSAREAPGGRMRVSHASGVWV
ncbi:hypothetical protein, partial [Planotetraspora silvatica]